MDNTVQADAAQALIFYGELVNFALDSGSAPGLPARREQLNGLALDAVQQKKLAELDAIVITDVVDFADIDTDLLKPSQQPLDHWWWHLGKMRMHSYPVQLLSKPLQIAYLEQDA